MTAFERRQLRRSIILGLTLTALTVLADSFDYLSTPEGWLYNLRALHCQRFMPPPTDKLIHLDIDDAALEERIGKWPWSRDKEAKIIDELRLAGAKALALDIMFPHPIHILGGLRETAERRSAGPRADYRAGDQCRRSTGRGRDLRRCAEALRPRNAGRLARFFRCHAKNSPACAAP